MYSFNGSAICLFPSKGNKDEKTKKGLVLKTVPNFAIRMPNFMNSANLPYFNLPFRVHTLYGRMNVTLITELQTNVCDDEYPMIVSIAYEQPETGIICSWKYVVIIAIIVFVITHLVMYLMKKYGKSRCTYHIVPKHRV